MNQPIELSVRITGKYRDGWSYLDRWEQVATAQVTTARNRKWEDGESFRQFLVVEIIACELRPRNIARAIMDTMSQSRCRHEHDCCGCVSTSVTKVRPLSGNRYAVRLYGSRNV